MIACYQQENRLLRQAKLSDISSREIRFFADPLVVGQLGENGNALQAQLDLVNLAVLARQSGQVTLLTLIKISSARPAWFDHSLNL
jgi:hypothetical protein